MNIKEIKEMINLMNENNLTELEVEKEGMRIRLKKSSSGEIIMDSNRSRSISQPQLGSYIPQTPQNTPTHEAPKEKSQTKTTEIKSPMVGTFYRSPSPDKEPFVKVGDIIRKGDHICIIEAMKLFNEIESEYDGKVLKVLVEDAKPVEYEQPLYLIEPA